MSDGFKRVPTVFNAEPGKTKLDVPKKSKKPFVSSFGKSTKVLADTVKQGSEIAKKSFASSAISVKKASRSLPTLKLKKRSREISEDDSIEAKVDKLFQSQDLLFERLDSEPKLSVAMRKSMASIKASAKSSAHYVRKQPLVAKILTLIAISALFGGFGAIGEGGRPMNGEPISEVAGVASDGSDTTASQEIPKEKPTFSVLLPKGMSEDEAEFAKISPEGNEPVYAFIDEVGGQQIRVSQQVVPKQFEGRYDTELEKVAKNFQATNIIQVDDTKVFHGTSERLRTQSLVFIKNKRLIFIASPQKQPDEVWVTYILSLQ